jgi:hypothetical protein
MSKVAAAVASALAVVASPFDTLLGELDTMAKAFPPKTDADGDKDGDKKKCKHGVEGCEKEGDHEHEMKKSFSITLADGSVVEVEDGAAMLKALSDRFDASEEKVIGTLTSAVAIIGSQGALVKSLSEQLATHETTIGAQATMIKSLQTDLGKLASTGAGRKAVLTVAERRTDTATAAVAKNGMPEGVTTEQFFAKAFEKQGMGKLTGADISLAETCLNNGHAIPDNLVSRVLS